MSREHPMPGQVLAVADLEVPYDPAAPLTTENIDLANVITSRVAGTEMHKPLLDIDLPIKVVPSSTPGHSHLYVDKELAWDAYLALLDALAEAGLVEPGYVSASRSRGFTSLRLPWIRKATNSTPECTE